MSAMRTSILRATRLSARRSALPSMQARFYASKQNMQTDQGQSSPGTASNVRPASAGPNSASAEQQGVKDSRGKGDVVGSPDTASVQTPVSNPDGASTGQQEDDSSAQEAFKQDPDKSAEAKRRGVEAQGQKPLDPADK